MTEQTTIVNHQVVWNVGLLVLALVGLVIAVMTYNLLKGKPIKELIPNLSLGSREI